MTTLTVPCAILPAELLLIIKDYIPISDLRTHVCYYHTCFTVASFYGDNSQQADFWRRSCSLSGLGWLKGDSSWKEIAFETIAKDGFCLHPACGGALLDWNAEQVASAMRRYDWDPEDGPWDATFEEAFAVEWEGENNPVPICSPAFKYIGYRKQPLPTWYADPDDVYLRNEDIAHIHRRAPLTAHPVVVRSLATFPSVRQMRFHYNGSTYGETTRGTLGVTVWDVIRTIQSELDINLSVQALLDLLVGPFSVIFQRKRSTNFIQDLERYSTLRGLYSATRWDGVQFTRSDGGGPVFRHLFSQLPEEISVERLEED